MLKAKDFRYYARESLRGRWLKAGGAGLVAGLLGGAISSGWSSGSSGSGAESGSSAAGTDMLASLGSGPDVPPILLAILMGVGLVLLLWAIVILVIGGATTLGYAKYNLNLVDDKNPKLKDIFSQYDRLGTGFGMQFFRGLFTFLWSLLFVIPGIIASYSYYMTPFILCERPDMTSREAIRESKELMRGNKWRLFCLEISFIGWELLASGVMGVVIMLSMTPMIMADGASADAIIVPVLVILLVVLIIFVIVLSLTLSPYITASIAVFYREISEGRYSNPHVELEGDVTWQTYEEVNFEEPS